METVQYKDELVQVIIHYFEEKDWKYKYDKDGNAFSTVVALKGRIPKTSLLILLGEDFYCVYAKVLLRPEEDELKQISELICRINNHALNGNFELDYEDRSICYKTYVNCDACLPSQEVIQDSILYPVFMIDKHSGIFFDVIAGVKSPADVENLFNREEERE